MINASFELRSTNGTILYAKGHISIEEVSSLINWRNRIFVCGIIGSLTEPMQFFETSQPLYVADSDLIVEE